MSIPNSVRQKTYRCQACPTDENRAKFKQLEEYATHLETERGWCKHCRAFFQTKEQATDHAYNTDYHCNICLKCFENESEAEAHRQNKHNDLQGDSSPVTKRDVYDDDPGSPLPTCHRCKKLFAKWTHYLDHECPVKQVDPANKFAPRTLQRTADGRLECYICETTFRTKGEATVHVKNQHYPVPSVLTFFHQRKVPDLASWLAKACGATGSASCRAADTYAVVLLTCPSAAPVIQAPTERAPAQTESRSVGIVPFSTVRNLKPYCREHDNIYKSSDNLVDHLISYHIGSALQCRTCNEEFTEAKAFKTHLAENQEHMKVILTVLVPSMHILARSDQRSNTSPRAVAPLRPPAQRIEAPVSVPNPPTTARQALPVVADRQMLPRGIGQKMNEAVQRRHLQERLTGHMRKRMDPGRPGRPPNAKTVRPGHGSDRLI
ncbi:hypothetical protein QFC21_003900 [Naganishia friedmannii]|uniref:Uncharacterized protein n=1 Tax=Naganishia friedmannii TaxID=89922 RepID=A0ACC2VKG1_9TREE|nr:hypothetical protein QFC21_003900 [Naganishia friedmannii]